MKAVNLAPLPSLSRSPSLSRLGPAQILIAGLLVLAAAPAGATDLRSTDVQPEGYPTVEAVKFMGAQLSKATGGKLNIKVFSSSALGSEKDTIEQTKIGAVVMTCLNLARTEHSMAPEILLFSKKISDGLSDDDRKAIRQAAKESVPYMRKLWDAREEKSLATLKASGAQIIEIKKAPFQAAMKPVYDKFVTDARMRELIKRIQDTK
jgi:TRAP-type C4-dicarboxylate transport system substrate-binding protein